MNGCILNEAPSPEHLLGMSLKLDLQGDENIRWISRDDRKMIGSESPLQKVPRISCNETKNELFLSHLD